MPPRLRIRSVELQLGERDGDMREDVVYDGDVVELPDYGRGVEHALFVSRVHGGADRFSHGEGVGHEDGEEEDREGVECPLSTALRFGRHGEA